MRKLIFILVAIIAFYACQKNPFWVGNKEFITINYSNDSQLGPKISKISSDKSPFIDYDNAYAVNTGNGSVQIIIDGVRVQSKSKNFEIKGVNVYEKDKNKFEKQDEFFNVPPSENKTNIAAVLVLDMSTSLDDLVGDLKEYAKSFVDQVVGSSDSSQVAVIFFSGKDDIEMTSFYNNSNAEDLKTEIDDFNNYQPRTALFEAVSQGINLLDQLEFNGTKALVTFTDGGDNDSNNPSTLISDISSSNYLRISIGLKGNDFDKDDLQSIADSKSNSIVVKDKKKLKEAFETVGRQVVSVYRLIYERSDQILDEEIEIKFEVEVDKIK